MCFLITNCKPELLSQGCCRPCSGVHLCKDAAGFMWMLIFARMPSLSRLPIFTWAAIFTHMLIQSAICSDTSYTTAPNLWPSSLPLILLLFLILYLMPFNSYSTQILAKGICYSCSDFFHLYSQRYSLALPSRSPHPFSFKNSIKNPWFIANLPWVFQMFQIPPFSPFSIYLPIHQLAYLLGTCYVLDIVLIWGEVTFVYCFPI